uniref:Uncharacterized protein n=1 Tax=Rangifer tarandus platyrhynchus TaxID=3082113 RepID=A0ACB0EMG2_RANTA|nr:unnamed protein product [Rangifer tarandus platyrhynchus]
MQEAATARKRRALREPGRPGPARPGGAAASGFQAPGPGLRRHLPAAARTRGPGGRGGDGAGGTEPGSQRGGHRARVGGSAPACASAFSRATHPRCSFRF